MRHRKGRSYHHGRKPYMSHRQHHGRKIHHYAVSRGGIRL